MRLRFKTDEVSFFKKIHVANHTLIFCSRLEIIGLFIKIPSHLATDNSVSIACILQKEVRAGLNGVKITLCPSPPVFYDKRKLVVQFPKKKIKPNLPTNTVNIKPTYKHTVRTIHTVGCTDGKAPPGKDSLFILLVSERVAKFKNLAFQTVTKIV